MSDGDVAMRNLNLDGTINTVKEPFITASERYIASLQELISTPQDQFICDCKFRSEDFGPNANFTSLETVFYFVDYNSMDALGKKIWNTSILFYSLVI